MDQIKIGKFIANCRKSAGLTQMQLAEKLNITDRAVSKWETGRAMPDSSIMLELCDILSISVNDLLKGEKICVEDTNKELEKNLIRILKQKEEADKRLLALEIVIGAMSIAVLFIPIIIGALLPIENRQRTLIIFSGFIPALIGFFSALKIEQVAGYYECKHCNHRYVPSFKSVILSMHLGRTRYLTCPNCHRRSYHKKVVNEK